MMRSICNEELAFFYWRNENEEEAENNYGSVKM